MMSLWETSAATSAIVVGADPYGNNTASLNPRISLASSSPNSSSTDTKIGAFNVSGTCIKRKSPQKVEVIDKQMELLSEYLAAPNPNIDIQKSQMADDLQEPRPMEEDDCPEAEEATNENNEKISEFAENEKSQGPTSKNVENDDLEIINSPIKSRCLQINDQNEKNRLFGQRQNPPATRIPVFTRSQAQKGFDPYEFSEVASSSSSSSSASRQTPTKLKRSFECQNEDDGFEYSSTNTPKPKKISKSYNNSPAIVPGKIPNLPINYEQLLESLNFQTKGRKQADVPFGELNIKGYDLYSLRTRQYVNDIIIDHYLQLICKRSMEKPEYRKSFALATFYSTMFSNGQQSTDKLISWIKKDLFDYELIFLPINQESHWFLFVADMVNRNYFIYDSLFEGDYKYELGTIISFLKAYSTSKGKEIEWNEWSEAPTENQLGPQQKNGVDCGIFLCQYAEHLSRNAPLDFAQCGMVNYRRRMLYELLIGELLDPDL